MAAASSATFAGPSTFDRLMSAIMSRSAEWIASSVEKPTFLTASIRLLRSFLSYAVRLGEGNHRHAHLVCVRYVVRGVGGPFFGRLDGFLDRFGTLNVDST